MSALIEGKNLGKSFGGLTAVKGVDFHLAEGEIVGLIGPNGAGKTTLFNLITGIFPPDTGTLSFNGANLLGRKPFEVCRLGRCPHLSDRPAIFEDDLFGEYLGGGHRQE